MGTKHKSSKYDRARVIADAKRFTYVGVPYSVALKEAWRAEKLRVLKRMLAAGVVEFTFKEAGAQVQRVIGTMVPHLIPAKQKATKPTRTTPIETHVAVYDTKEDKWKQLNVSTADIEIL